MARSFDTLLDSYADLALRLGVNLQPGQGLWIRGQVDAAPLVRRVAEKAYRMGASEVNVAWSDEAITLAMVRAASEEELERFPAWLAEAADRATARGDALLSLSAPNPTLFEGEDVARIGRLRRARQKALKPVLDRSGSDAIAWCVVVYPNPAWAALVFPDAAPEEALARLWQAVFQAVRVDQGDPLAAWRDHLEALERRKAILNARAYAALHFRGPGTDLTVGLVDHHRWEAGGSRSPAGIDFVPNLPTEEVFTAPHRCRVDGVVTSSKPLGYAGQIIERFELTFRDGVVVGARARKGQDALESILATDDGAKRLGEVALVPEGSPIARSGILFRETLFDENAASHVALGTSYRTNLDGGVGLSDGEALEAGLNDSLTHVDFMIGSPEVDVDGVGATGEREPLMRAGEWAL